MQPAIDIHDLGFRPGGDTILDGVDLRIEPGELVCVLGPSGAGKSTMLRLAGGLMAGTGEVRIFGETPDQGWRRLAYVFQTPRLVRWRTALDNVMLGLELRRGRSARGMREHGLACLRRVGIADLADRPAHLLSGGEQQRVAIARALAVEPDVLFMDEPFSALDVNTRTELRRELVQWWQEAGLTILFVTHDIDEALELGTRAVVFSRKPTRVAGDIAIDAPYPRDHGGGAYAEARDQVLAAFGPDAREARHVG